MLVNIYELKKKTKTRLQSVDISPKLSTRFQNTRKTKVQFLSRSKSASNFFAATLSRFFSRGARVLAGTFALVAVHVAVQELFHRNVLVHLVQVVVGGPELLVQRSHRVGLRGKVDHADGVVIFREINHRVCVMGKGES